MGLLSRAEHMEHWKKIAIGGVGLSGVYFVMSLFAEHEHKEDATPCASRVVQWRSLAAGWRLTPRAAPDVHMNMRDKAMPWKSNCAMLDFECHRQYKLAKAGAQ